MFSHITGQGSAAAASSNPGLRRLASFRLILILAAFALLAGCAGTRGGPIAYNQESFGTPDSPTTMILGDDYKIAPMDTLRISVFQVPDLTGDFEVDLSGNIAMPLIGNVKAVDLTPDQLDTALTQQLGAKYLQNPDVSVGIKSSTRRNVTVDGSVRQPGVFPLNGPTTLMQVIALARGTDESANPRRVAVFRQISGQRMAAAFDLTSIRRGQAEDPRVYAGDIVVVDGSKSKEIYGRILSSIPLLTIFRPF